MLIQLRIRSKLLASILSDLRRPHPFAFERVGFISCRVGEIPTGIVLLAHDFHPVADDDYIQDDSVGAMMGSRAIGKAQQFCYRHEVGMFHVHLHEHEGPPWFSRIDLRENSLFVPDFFKTRPHMPHGAIVLSADSAAGLCWMPSRRKVRISEFNVVGAPMKFVGRR